MQRVQFVPNSFGVTGLRRWAAIAFAVSINAALIYALVSGLAIRFVEQLPSVLQVEVVKPQQVAKPVVPPPPAPDMSVPTVPQIPVPKITIAHPAPTPQAITAIAVEKPVVAPSAPVAKPVPAVAPTPARGIARTHTTPPYPPLAIRLSQQGTVRLHIVLDNSGAIRGVDVLKTSGSEVLDQAAVAWVSKHWRYEPATREGKPIASSVLADVKFDLRNAR